MTLDKGTKIFGNEKLTVKCHCRIINSVFLTHSSSRKWIDRDKYIMGFIIQSREGRITVAGAQSAKRAEVLRPPKGTVGLHQNAIAIVC